MFKSILQKGIQQGPKLFSQVGKRDISTRTGQKVVVSLTDLLNQDATEKVFEGFSEYGDEDEVHKVGVADFLSRSDIKEALKGKLSSRHSASQIERLLEMAKEKSIEVDPVPIFAARNYNEELFEESLDKVESLGLKKAVFTGGSFAFDGLGLDIMTMMQLAQRKGIEPISTISPLGRSVGEMQEYAKERGVKSFVSELVMDPNQIANLVEALQGYDLTIAHPMPSNGNFIRRENGKARKVKYNEAEQRFEQQQDFLRNVAFEEDGTLSSGSRLPPNVVEMPSSLFNESGHVPLDVFNKQIQENLKMLEGADNVSHWIRGYSRTNVKDEFSLLTGKDLIE